MKNLLLLSAEFRNGFVYAHAAFWLPVYYFSVCAEPMEIRPVPWRCQTFPCVFLSVTSLCIPLKHTDPCLVRGLGGTRNTPTNFKHRAHEFCLWDASGSRCLPNSCHYALWPFSVMKHWLVMVWDFFGCYLPTWTRVDLQVFNLNKLLFHFLKLTDCCVHFFFKHLKKKKFHIVGLTLVVYHKKALRCYMTSEKSQDFSAHFFL